MERGGTRAMAVERMCARRLTPDERAPLGVFARAPAGRAAETARTLRDMVAPAAVGPALERTSDVARALAGAGHALACEAGPGAERAGAPTLH